MLQIQAKGGGAADTLNTFSIVLATIPEPKNTEILVKVLATSINPLDTKVRMRAVAGTHVVVGHDTCGVIEKTGAGVSHLRKGDKIFFMGQSKFAGSFAQYQLADARTVALVPESSSDAETAVLPVAGFTAYDALFTRLGHIASANSNIGKTLLVIGGAGGVGSMAIQLAKWAGLTVIATASREETVDWCKDMGADYVINHHKDMPAQIQELGLNWVNSIFCTSHLSAHWNAMAKLIKPQGSIVLIDDPDAPVDLRIFKTKSIKICWEFAMVRTMYETADLNMQGMILAKLAQLIDTQQIKTPLTETLYGLTIKNIQLAHIKQESQKMVGKQAIVINN